MSFATGVSWPYITSSPNNADIVRILCLHVRGAGASCVFNLKRSGFATAPQLLVAGECPTTLHLYSYHQITFLVV